MAIFRSDLERSWARMVFMLALLIVLFALLRHAALNGKRVAEAAPAQGSGFVEVARSTRVEALHFPVTGHEHALRDNFHETRGGIRKHKALDIMAARGTPVVAVDDGVIAKLYRGPMAGISIYQFDAAGTRVYFYAHLDRYAKGLAEGARVSRGEVIGYVGSTGNAPEHAPHLHFAVHALGADKRWWKGEAINPYTLLRPREHTASGAR